MIEANPISRLLLVAIYWAFRPRAGLRKKLLHTPVPPALTAVNVQGRIHWSSVMFFRLRPIAPKEFARKMRGARHHVSDRLSVVFIA